MNHDVRALGAHGWIRLFFSCFALTTQFGCGGDVTDPVGQARESAQAHDAGQDADSNALARNDTSTAGASDASPALVGPPPQFPDRPCPPACPPHGPRPR